MFDLIDQFVKNWKYLDDKFDPIQQKKICQQFNPLILNLTEKSYKRKIDVDI